VKHSASVHPSVQLPVCELSLGRTRSSMPYKTTMALSGLPWPPMQRERISRISSCASLHARYAADTTITCQEVERNGQPQASVFE
jgi:hypothetical protein